MLPSVNVFRSLFANKLLFRSRPGPNLQDVKWGGLAASGQRRDKIVGLGGARWGRVSWRERPVRCTLLGALVDADAHSIDMIRWAISTLQKAGAREVRTTVYAPPQRALNAKWKLLFDEHGIQFHAVPRGTDSKGEANDRAIVIEIQTLSGRLSADGCIALMTGDADFVNTVSMAVTRGIEVVVFISELALSQIRLFRSAGVRVVTIRAQPEKAPRVRAVLHMNGCGEVQVLEPFVYAPHEEEEMMAIANFLQSLQYFEEEQYLVQSIAKFWFTNRLGALTVFPSEAANRAALARVTEGKNSSYSKYSKKLAFFLPVCSPSVTKALLHKYGNRRAQAVFRGGGPFVVADSRDLVSRALRRLNFLDSEWNPNLAEAMLAFVNVSENKRRLRKQFNASPSRDDTASQVEERLRHAFLSNRSDGEWKVAPKDSVAREILLREGLLGTRSASKALALEAMKTHASQHGLPRMQNYDSYVRYTLGRVREAQPTTLGDVQFRV